MLDCAHRALPPAAAGVVLSRRLCRHTLQFWRGCDMQQDQLGKSFGLIIGFLIPGMVGLYGVSLHVETIEGWFSVASTAQSSSVGGFLFVLVASIGVGVFISNVRWLVLERWIWKREPPKHDASARKGTQTELVYQNLVCVPHPVSWTHVCATRHGVARIPRALRAACDTPASRGASTGCSVRRTRRRRRAPRRGFERPGRRWLAP